VTSAAHCETIEQSAEGKTIKKINHSPLTINHRRKVYTVEQACAVLIQKSKCKKIVSAL